jgi:hypothetical protein
MREKKMAIKAIKLVSGEELIVEILDDVDAELTFTNPVACVLQRGKDGAPILGFMPWMQASNSSFKVKKNHILVIAEVADKVKNEYNRIFGAGIVVPPKQLITG